VIPLSSVPLETINIAPPPQSSPRSGQGRWEIDDETRTSGVGRRRGRGTVKWTHPL